MKSRPTSIDQDLLRARPLPQPDSDTDKNKRGRVFVIGGSRTVPGGLILTSEGALRAGAGKVQIATIHSAVIALGVALPECGIIGLAEDAQGDIEPGAAPAVFAEAADQADAIVAGCAMTGADAAGSMVDKVIDRAAPLIIDAAALLSLGKRVRAIAGRSAATILTPHAGEMAAVLDRRANDIAAEPVEAARLASARFRATCILKGARTIVAEPNGTTFSYDGGGVGMATGGSGDVLAGIVCGLVARGSDPVTAAVWAVWLHGEAGRRCARAIGPLGFLSRELVPYIPVLMSEVEGFRPRLIG